MPRTHKPGIHVNVLVHSSQMSPSRFASGTCAPYSMITVSSAGTKFSLGLLDGSTSGRAGSRFAHLKVTARDDGGWPGIRTTEGGRPERRSRGGGWGFTRLRAARRDERWTPGSGGELAVDGQGAIA